MKKTMTKTEMKAIAGCVSNVPLPPVVYIVFSSYCIARETQGAKYIGRELGGSNSTLPVAHGAHR